MQKIEVCRKIDRFVDHTLYTVIYYLTVDSVFFAGTNFECYGVGAEILETGEECFVRCITANTQRAEHLVDLLATECILPATLKGVLAVYGN